MVLRLRLKEFLDEHDLTAYRLVCALRGKVAQASVYGMLRSDKVKRVDLQTLGGILGALRDLSGEDVRVSDLLDELEEGPPHPGLAKLLLDARPCSWERLMGLSARFSPQDLERDEKFWADLRAGKAEELRQELKRTRP